MVRTGTVDDCFEVYSIICEMEDYKLDYDIFKEIYKKIIDSDSYEVLVYLEGKQIVGVITLRFEWQLHHCAKIAEIMECAVKKDYRSGGRGRLLFESACKLAKNKKCAQIEVSSNYKRTRAHNFYKKVGMEDTHYKFCKLL